MPRLNSPTFKGKVQGRTYLAGRGETQIKASPPTDIIFPPSSLALIVNFLCCAAWRGGKVFYELQPFWAEEQRKRRKGAAFAIKSSIRLLGRGDDNPFGLPIWDGGGRRTHSIAFSFSARTPCPFRMCRRGEEGEWAKWKSRSVYNDSIHREFDYHV